MTPIYIATEDALSEAVVDRLVAETEGKLTVAVRMRRNGFGYLKKKLPELYQLAYAIPVLLLTDLDQGECAPSLRDEWFNNRDVPAKFLFRVAVREVEAWLISDKERFAAFTRVPTHRIRDNPELLVDPKQELLNLIARHSPAALRKDVVARRPSGPKQGLAYNERLSEFVRNSWRPRQAARQSQSLARTMQRIEALASA